VDVPGPDRAPSADLDPGERVPPTPDAPAPIDLRTPAPDMALPRDTAPPLPDARPPDRAPDIAPDLARDTTPDSPPSVPGLDRRPGPQTCRAPARPTGLMNDPFPRTLAATGCFEAADPSKPVAGAIPYRVNVELWSDGAAKERWLALPDGARIRVASDGDWDLPVGSVLIKLFRLGGRPIETRLFVRHQDGEWAGYTYEWNDQRTEAALVGEDAKKKPIGNQEWLYPGRMNCLNCHTKAAGGTLGLETSQLNGELLYPATGRRANQLLTLEQIGMFEAPLGRPAAMLPAFPDVDATAVPVETRARAYLHANCAGCHRPGGLDGAPDSMGVNLDLRHQTTFAATQTCNVAPAKSNLGSPSNRLVVPGDPALSIVTIRMESRGGLFGMPPFGDLTDVRGHKLVSDWIRALPTMCP
jgi:uncharacterized repeat protein (TIGR03806 family)